MCALNSKCIGTTMGHNCRKIKDWTSVGQWLCDVGHDERERQATKVGWRCWQGCLPENVTCEMVWRVEWRLQSTVEGSIATGNLAWAAVLRLERAQHVKGQRGPADETLRCGPRVEVEEVKSCAERPQEQRRELFKAILVMKLAILAPGM